MSSFDPTSLISATTAGVRLVGAVLDVKGKYDHNKRTTSGTGDIHALQRGPGESDVTGASTSAPGLANAGHIQSLALQRVDPERESRAYETVNFVLRTIGSRILEANMVNIEALARALTAATSHIEVRLFSGETNRLFQSLAHKLNDVNLVNSVFTSIYLVGFLTAELTSSLPNYKREYPALGPTMVQQMMRVAIGDDAFRENQTANLNAYQTVATTAGLLKPTDIGYSIFPEFPSFSPTKYSSKSMLDRNSHKNVLDKLVKHFETFGFPQPLQGRDVGPIRDWRFLASDSNSRAFEVDKADKQIGSCFGRVLYWLICSAHRMPSGMAVVAYYDQHIALIRYLGPRFGYRVLNTGGDLNMSGPHLQLNKKLRATFDTWVVIMPSESLIAERHKALQQGNQHAAQQAAHAQGFQPSMAAGSLPQQLHMPGIGGHGPQQSHVVVPPGIGQGLPQPQMLAPQGTGPAAGPATIPNNQYSGVTPQSPDSGTGRLSISSEISSKPLTSPHPDHQMESLGNSVSLMQLNSYEHFYTMVFQERCNRFVSDPPTDIDMLKEEYSRLVHDIQSNTLSKIEALDTTADEAAGLKKKGLLEVVKGALTKIEAVYHQALAASSPPSRPSSVASVPSVKRTPSTNQANFGMSAPPSELAGSSVSYGSPITTTTSAQELSADTASPAELGTAAVNPITAHMASPVSASPVAMSTPPSPSPAPGLSTIPKRPSVVRRKAPPPPKKVILAKALYDFEPEDEEGGEELTFSEGDIIEIVEKNKQLEEDGWCRARVRGQKKLGLAPLDYLEELPNQPSGPPSRPSRVSSASTTTTIFEHVETLSDLNALKPTQSALILSKPDTEVDIKVSSTSQKPPSTPNAASPTYQQSNKPNFEQKPHLTTMDSINENNPIIAPDQPPPPYSAATSQPSTSATFTSPPQKPSDGPISIGSLNPPAKPLSQSTSSTEQFTKPPIKPTQPSNQPVNQLQQPTHGAPIQSQQVIGQYQSQQPTNGVPAEPQQVGGQYQSPNVQNFQPPPMSTMPQNSSIQPQTYAGGAHAMPMMNPGTAHHGAGFMGHLDSYVALAGAASELAQAGAHVFTAIHPPSSSHEPEHHHESHDNETSPAGGQPNHVIHNTNNLSQNTTSTSNDNSINQAVPTNNTNTDNNNTFNSNTDNNQSTSNSYSQNNQGPSYDYIAPYYPPETTATSYPNLTSASLPQDATYGTTTSMPGGRAALNSNLTIRPNVRPNTPSTAPTQYVSDPSSNTGISSSTSIDISSSASNQDNSGVSSLLASLATPSVLDPNQYSASPDYSIGTSISPLASLATPGPSDSYTVTSVSSTQIDSPQPTSPLASLAISGLSTNTSSNNVAASVTSPSASVILAETTNSGGGYFDASTTVTVTTDATSNAASPPVGLANSSNVDVISSTATTTDMQYGYGNIYSGNAGVDNTTTTTTTVDYSNNNGGNWNTTAYTNYPSNNGGNWNTATYTSYPSNEGGNWNTTAYTTTTDYSSNNGGNWSTDYTTTDYTTTDSTGWDNSGY